jgi:hypothetical protein
VVSGVVCGARGVAAGALAGGGYVMALRGAGELALTRSLAARLSLEARRLAGDDAMAAEMDEATGPVGVGASVGVVMRF